MDSLAGIMLFFIFALIFGIITASIANKKGHNAGIWFIFGLLLFIVALPLALLLPKNTDTRKCAYCGEWVHKKDSRCLSCKRSQPDVHWGGKTSTANWEKAKQIEDPVEKWAKNQDKTDGNI